MTEAPERVVDLPNDHPAMLKARRIVEEHIRIFGQMVPHPDFLKRDIANAILQASRSDLRPPREAELREVLKFYAEKMNYCSVLRFILAANGQHIRDPEAIAKTPVLVDSGERARAALSGTSEPTEA